MKILKIIATIFLLLSISSTLYSQTLNIDSLIILQKNTQNKSENLRLLNQIANELRYTNIEESFKYLIKSEKLALELKDWNQLAESYILQGIVWKKRGEIDSAFYYLNKGLDISKKYDNYNGIIKSLNSLALYTYYKKDYQSALQLYKDGLLVVDNVSNLETVIMLYNNISMLYKSIGEYDVAIEFYHKAIQLCEETNNLKGSGIVSSNLGLIYEKQGKHSRALEYLNKSLEIRRARKNLVGESIVLNNLGVIYEGIGEYEKALEYYNQSLKIKQQINLNSGVAKIYNNIGIIYKILGKIDSAHFNYNKSLALSREFNDRTGVSHTYTNIGILYKQEFNYKKAIQYFIEAARIAEADKDIQEQVRIYKGLYECYNSIGKYKKAFEYSNKYQIVHDSIYNLNSKKYIEEVEGKYQNLKKEKENQALLKDNLLKDEKLKRQVVLGVLIIFLTLSVLVILLIVVRSKGRLEKQKKALRKANDELIKLNSFNENMTNMIAHDLKNPLNSIINISRFKRIEKKEKLIQQAGKQMLNLISNMIDVYKNEHSKMILHKSTAVLSDIIYQALDDVEYILNFKKIEVEVNKDFDIVIQIDEEIIKRVFVNLLTNAIKFSPQNGLIKIGYSINSEKELRITVENQGEEIPKEFHGSIFELYKQEQKQKSGIVPSSGLGLAFCKMAIEAHLGKIGVISETNKNVTFWFTLPDYQVREAINTIDKLEINTIVLTEKDKEFLQSYINQIKSFNIYEVSSIRAILKKIDRKNQNINNWVEELNEALFSGNIEQFNKLIEL